MKTTRILLTLTTLAVSAPAFGFFIDGEGHYGLMGETEVAPGFSKNTGTYQAIQQSFRLTGEVRANDQLSAFMELRLFPESKSYLGDEAQPVDCQPRSGADPNGQPVDPDLECEDRIQNTGEPRYKPYEPQITKAYVRYAFDYCIVEAGRRPRDWGLGMFLDAGEDPFEYDASVFDGVDCKINVQKSQVLGFSIGFDKLQETGYYVYDPYLHPGDINNKREFEAQDRAFGTHDAGDDIDQFFFTIEYDDRKANAGAAFTKQIGVYFSQANAKSLKDGGANTDLKFLDLYTGFYFSDLAFRNELLFRMGKSADPSWLSMGGTALNADGDPETNKVQTIALAGDIEWTISRSGAVIGPAEYNQGDASRHLMRFEYAYAPGDEKGYYGRLEEGVTPTAGEAELADETYGAAMRGEGAGKGKAEAYAFHRNYQPALIFFNGRPAQDDMARDGVFNPSRLLNASIYALSYKYESLEGGNFEVKAVTGHLNESVPQPLKDFYESKAQTTGTDADGNGEPDSADSGNRPPGYYGLFVGYELDLIYSYKIGREAELGVAAAAAIPGDAWKTNEDINPANNFLLQSYATFKF